MSYEQLLVALLASFWGSAGEVMGLELRPSDHLCRLGISWTLPFFGLSVECVGLGPLWETSLVAFATLLDGFCYGFGCTAPRLGVAMIF